MREGFKQINDSVVEKAHKALARTIAKNVKALKKKREMTNEQVAEEAGLTVRFFYKVISEKHTPNLTTLIRLARVFDVSVSKLLEE